MSTIVSASGTLQFQNAATRDGNVTVVWALASAVLRLVLGSSISTSGVVAGRLELVVSSQPPQSTSLHSEVGAKRVFEGLRFGTTAILLLLTSDDKIVGGVSISKVGGAGVARSFLFSTRNCSLNKVVPNPLPLTGLLASVVDIDVVCLAPDFHGSSTVHGSALF